jgi:transcriptional regulator with XRE-family HTH domain
MLLSEKLSTLRKSKGVSQELLAENSRVSLRTIQRIESGKVTPRPHTLKIIAEVLGVQISELSSSEPDLDIDELSILRLVNASALTAFILPVSNIIFPLLIWRKHRHLPGVNAAGKKIISFQVLWTLGILIIPLSSHLILRSITGSVSIGRLPPTVFLVYFILLTVNGFFIIQSAIHLGKGKKGIYTFVPSLF